MKFNELSNLVHETEEPLFALLKEKKLDEAKAYQVAKPGRFHRDAIENQIQKIRRALPNPKRAMGSPSITLQTIWPLIYPS